MIQLLLVDDQNIVRKGLRVLLEAQPYFQVVGEAENGHQSGNCGSPVHLGTNR